MHVAAAEGRLGRDSRECFGAVAVERGVDGAEALHGDAGARQLLGLDVGRIALGQQLGGLLGGDAVRVGIEQQPLEPLLLRDGAEAHRLDAAPGEERGACRGARGVERSRRGGFAQRPSLIGKRARRFSEAGIARQNDAVVRLPRQRRVVECDGRLRDQKAGRASRPRARTPVRGANVYPSQRLHEFDQRLAIGLRQRRITVARGLRFAAVPQDRFLEIARAPVVQEEACAR